MNRRSLLALMSGSAAIALAPAFFGRGAAAQECGFEICRTEAEWKAMLSDAEYAVMREEDTERPYTSPLNDENRDGTFLCRGCDLPLYASETKFDSGTGWPSFYAAIDGAVKTKRDFKLLLPRTEVHCRRCGSHLGHIFNDGPQPTGKRHCINGVSLTFRPASA